MRRDNGQPSDHQRFQEQLVGQDVAEMVLQVLKSSFAKRQSWRYDQQAAYRFQKAARIIEEEFRGRDPRYCFGEAAELLTVDLHEDDLWGEAAAAGARHYLQIISSHGHAYDHRGRTRDEFIAAVEAAMAGRRRR